MTFEWTVERVDRLRAMHSDGAPFGDIASALGTTEVSAKKKAHRLGLPKRSASYSANIRWQNGERTPGFFRLDFRRNGKASAPRYIGPVKATGSHPVDLIERDWCCEAALS